MERALARPVLTRMHAAASAAFALGALAGGWLAVDVGLLACLPGQQRKRVQTVDGKRRLYAIRGQVSSPLAPPPGCAFEPRCDKAIAACREAMPALRADDAGGSARCILVPEAA